jgi:hypothetical protein
MKMRMISLIALGAMLAVAGTPETRVASAAGSSTAAVDFTGDWQRYPGFSRGGPAPDPATLPPPAGKMQLKAKYKGPYDAQRAKEAASDANGEPIAASGVDCLPYGMPEMMSAIYPLEILQTSNQVTIIAEAFSQVRRIYLGKTQSKIEDVAPGYYGHSVAHWDGSTLVVDTVGVKESVLGHSEMPHSDKMRITERLHLVTPDILHDQITVEDPVTLEQPWTFTFAYKRMPNYEMLEYICENNHEYIDDKGVTHLRLQDNK